MRLFTLLTSIILLKGSFSLALPIIELELTSSQQMCSVIQCVSVAPGKVGIYNNPFLNNPLAYGTLAENTDLGGITLPAGVLVTFDDPGQSSFYGFDFKVRFSSNTKLGGVELAANQPISFGRFEEKWDSVQQKFQWIPYADGSVRIGGTLAEAQTISTLPLRTGSDVIYDTTVAALYGSESTSTKLFSGVIGAQAFLAAPRPIEVLPGDSISLSDQFVALSAYPGRVIQPEGFRVSRIRYFLDTGLPQSFTLLEEVSIDGLWVEDSVRFFPGGKIEKAQPASTHPQSVHGVQLDGEMSYYGEMEFYDNGEPLTLPTLFVTENSALLPQAILPHLPDKMTDGNRVQFFFNPQGKIRALVIDTDEWTGFATHWMVKVYAVSGESGQLTFHEVNENENLYSYATDSDRGGVSSEMLDYLRTH